MPRGTGTLTFYVVNHDSTTAGKYEYDKVVVAGVTLPTTGNGILDNVNLNSEGSYKDSAGNMSYTTGGTGVSITAMNVTNLTDLGIGHGDAERLPEAGRRGDFERGCGSLRARHGAVAHQGSDILCHELAIVD